MVKLQLSGLGARYGRVPVLSGICTPAFHAGEVVAVIGPNAAGKSTLFRRIAGIVDGEGEVLLDASRKGMEGICYMPQDISANARLTVYESVLLACKQQRPSWAVHDAELAMIDRVLASLGIADLAFRYLGELSGGQRQLASIAQTLAREPEILLMDEPTSALDLHRQVQVLDFVRKLASSQEMIVLIAMHDLNQALRFSDQVLVVGEGTALASGPSRDVITTDLLRKVYRVNARIERCSQGLDHVIVDGVA
jgi:iron complex transport system ATP-binding protein